MKFSFGLLVLCLSAGSVFAGAQTGDNSVKAALEVRYQLMDEAFVQRDIHRYLSVAVQDLVTIDDDKTFAKREQFESHLGKGMGAFQNIYAFKSHINKIEVIDDFARTEVTSDFDGTMPDKKDPSVIHRYAIQLKFIHEWRKIGGEWELTRFVEVGETGAVDGKPIPAEQK